MIIYSIIIFLSIKSKRIMFFRCPIINYLIANLYTPKRVASLINKKTRLSFSYLCIYIYLSKYFPEKIIIEYHYTDICNYLLNIRCYRIRWQYVLNTHRRNICVAYILIKVFRVECTWKKYKKKKKTKKDWYIYPFRDSSLWSGVIDIDLTVIDIQWL